MKIKEFKILLKKIIIEELKLLEGGGEEAGNLELVNIDIDKAIEYCKKINFDINAIKNFDKNFKFAQMMAGKGKTQRKDMPVINDDDVKQFQNRLKQGYIDINEPFSSTYDKKNPFPKGLKGFDASDFLERGLKDKSKTDDIVELTIKRVKAGNLKPIQKQIYFDKAISSTAKFGIDGTIKFLTTKTFFITSDDNYIIDGHHRWLSALLLNPSMQVNALSIDLPIKELLPLSTAYGDAIGNTRNA